MLPIVEPTATAPAVSATSRKRDWGRSLAAAGTDVEFFGGVDGGCGVTDLRGGGDGDGDVGFEGDLVDDERLLFRDILLWSSLLNAFIIHL